MNIFECTSCNFATVKPPFLDPTLVPQVLLNVDHIVPPRAFNIALQYFLYFDIKFFLLFFSFVEWNNSVEWLIRIRNSYLFSRLKTSWDNFSIAIKHFDGKPKSTQRLFSLQSNTFQSISTSFTHSLLSSLSPLSLFRCLLLSHAYILTYILSHIRTRWHAHSIVCTLTQTYTHTLTQTHKPTQKFKCTPTHTCTHNHCNLPTLK